jgi:hypothetical protein
MAVIPAWVIEEAVEQCEKTLKNNNPEPLIDRIRKLLDKFKDQSVSKEMVEKYMGYKVDLFTEKDGLKLTKVYTAIKDGVAEKEEYFEIKKDVVDPFEQIKAESEGGKK